MNVFRDSAEKEAFDKYIASLLPMDMADAERKVTAALTPHIKSEADLTGKTREELLAMLPPELRNMVEPPKGWFRTTGKMRRLMKKPSKYLFEQPARGPKRMARKIP